jgi:hypothetical protein
VSDCFFAIIDPFVVENERTRDVYAESLDQDRPVRRSCPMDRHDQNMEETTFASQAHKILGIRKPFSERRSRWFRDIL